MWVIACSSHSRADLNSASDLLGGKIFVRLMHSCWNPRVCHWLGLSLKQVFMLNPNLVRKFNYASPDLMNFSREVYKSHPHIFSPLNPICTNEIAYHIKAATPILFVSALHVGVPDAAVWVWHECVVHSSLEGQLEGSWSRSPWSWELVPFRTKEVSSIQEIFQLHLLSTSCSYELREDYWYSG